jgi:stage II sporulation protein AA (anti-sigma F factor antagonist)
VTDATMTVTQDSDDTVRIALAGEIDMDNAGQVEHQILGAITNQLTGVTLDLSGIEYIDSAGLRVLFTLGSRLGTLQIVLRVLVPERSPIRRVIDLSGMASAIPVRSS